MQEPEQPQRSEQRWQKYSDFCAEYGKKDETERQQEFPEIKAGEYYQGQKIYPQKKRSLSRKTLNMIAVIFSSLGFFVAAVGFILSSTVVNYANGREDRLIEGTIGHISSIVLMLVCITIFVTAAVKLALQAKRWRKRES